jgi:hypothetical protein
MIIILFLTIIATAVRDRGCVLHGNDSLLISDELSALCTGTDGDGRQIVCASLCLMQNSAVRICRQQATKRNGKNFKLI